MKKKKVLLAAVLSSALIALVGCSDGEESVATFDGGKVTKEALYQELAASNGEQTVNVMVRDSIVEKEAEKLKVTVSKKELEESLVELKAQYGSDEAFEQALETYNVTKADIEKDMKSDLLLEKVLKKQVKVTEDEMKAYFEENKEQFSAGEEVKASHILVETEKEAKDLIKQLNEGADFAKLAKEHSKDTGSAIEGGDLGFFGKGKMTETFEKAAFALEIGKVSEPVKSEFGFHIIKVAEKKEAKKATFEDNKKAVKEALTNQKLQAEYSTWLEKKFEEYNVKLKLK